MKISIWPFVLIGAVVLAGCSALQPQTPMPTVTVPAPLIFVSTETPTQLPLLTPTLPLTATVTPLPAVAPDFCADPQSVALLDSLKRAMVNEDGPLLGSLVSPNGMEVRYYRTSTQPVKYSAEQAQFLFETTYQANWGADPASGMDKTGAFHDVIVPRLRQVFNSNYTMHCNELRHGGATYTVSWPYPRDFYAIYFAGTEQYSNMDWNTWGVGIEYSNGRPYIYALVQYFWEP